METAKWSLYLAHACRRSSLVEPRWEPSVGEQQRIFALDIQLDYYDYQADSQKIRFVEELTSFSCAWLVS